MNLASRCREAISHVSMLKKELTMHQRRAAEALALQRQESQSLRESTEPLKPIAVLSPRNSKLKTDVAAEMERMDRLMAVHAPPPPPPIPPPPRDVIAPRAKENGSPRGEFFSDYNEEKKSPSEDMVPVSFNTKPIFPHSASPRVTDRDRESDYNEAFPDDLPPSTRKKKLHSSIFKDSPDEISEIESEAGSVTSTSAAEARKTIMSSLDAFEASFATDFPESFSGSPKEGEQQTVVYNPFAPSPQRNPDQMEPSAAEIAKARNAPAPPQIPPSNKKSSEADEVVKELLPPRLSTPRPTTMENSNHSTNSSTAPSTPTRAIREVTPPTSDAPETPPVNYGSPEQPTTPKSAISQKGTPDDTEQPRRPEKTISASARARYEKALQPRGYSPALRASSYRKTEKEVSSDQQEVEPEQQESPPESPKSARRTPLDVARNRFRAEPITPETFSTPSRGKSPSMVLKRLQERKIVSPNVSKTAIPTKPASPLVPITSSQRTSTASPVTFSQRASTASPVTSRQISSSLPSTATPTPRVPPSSLLGTPNSSAPTSRQQASSPITSRTTNSSLSSVTSTNQQLSSPLISRSSKPTASPSLALAAAKSLKAETSTTSKAVSPFPRTQPSTLPNMTTPEVSADSRISTSPTDSSTRSGDSSTTPSTSSAIKIFEKAASPSVSSAISAYEQAAKRNDTVTSSGGRSVGSASRASYRSSFTPKSRAPSPITKPFDEDESAPIPPASVPTSRTSARMSAREFQLEYGRKMSDEERHRWTGPRASSEREMQASAKRSAAHDRGSTKTDDSSSASSNDNFHNSYPARNNRVVTTPVETSSHGGAAGTTLPASSRASSRRTVKQPVSYAEPSLNSKLRRGDTYFNKDQDDLSKRKTSDAAYHAASVRL